MAFAGLGKELQIQDVSFGFGVSHLPQRPQKKKKTPKKTQQGQMKEYALSS